MLFDITTRVAEAREYYDKELAEKCDRIASLAKVDRSLLVPMNPCDFIEKNRFQLIRGHHYQMPGPWIRENKGERFLVSPTDDAEKTAEQIGYKSHTTVARKIRASKCAVVPIGADVLSDFCRRNHRQGPPLTRKTMIAFGLVCDGELVAAMNYDIQNGGVRARVPKYELVRLAIAKNTQVHGGASKLQKACERTLAAAGITEVYSYSNATLNTGGVYRSLGFECGKVESGQPFVIMKDNSIVRLISLFPHSTDEELALRGRIRFRLGGNVTWTKRIAEAAE